MIKLVPLMQRRVTPIAVAGCILLFLCMFVKTRYSQSMVVMPPAVIGGFAIGFALLTVHELLHAIVYPKKACVTIGKVRGKLLFVALASYPLSRVCFILMCLLPYVLGIVPLTAFWFSPAEQTMVNGLLFGMASMGMISPYLDLFNVITVLKNTKKGDRLMFYEDELYKISR